MKKPSLTLTGKFLLLACLIILPVIAGFFYTLNEDKKIIKGQVLDNLTSVAEAYEVQVYLFLEMAKRRVEDFSSDGLLSDELDRIASGKGRVSPALREHLVKNKLPLDRYIKGLAVFDAEGRFVTSTDPDADTTEVSKASFFRKALSGPFVTEGTLGPERALIILAPVRNRKTGKTLGVIAGYITLSDLSAVLKGELSRDLGALTWKGGARTMEVYLADGKGRMIANSRINTGPGMARKVDTLPVKACQGARKEISAFYRDYRGVDVAGASMCMPSLGWTLVVKLDADETLLFAMKTWKSALVAGNMAMGGALLFFMLFYRDVIKKVKNITEGALRLAGGNYDLEIPVDTDDEIGALTKAFNRMASEIKKRKDELTRALEGLRKAQRVARMGSWEWDIVNNRLHWSEEIYRIFEKSPEEFGATYEAFLDMVHPEDRESVKEAVDEALYGGRTYSIDHRIVLPDGEVRVVHEDASVAFDEERRPLMMLGTVQDITERYRAEEQRRARLERMAGQRAALVEITKMEINEEFGLEKSIRFITETAARTMDVERVGVWFLEKGGTELVCRDLFELSSGRHTGGAVLAVADFPEYFSALESGRAVDACDARHDPRTACFTETYLKPLDIFSMLDAPVRLSGRVIGVVCHEHTGRVRRWTEDEVSFAADIADQVARVMLEDGRRKAEKALRASEARYRTLFETANDAIVTMGEDGTVWSFNRAAERVFGYSADEITGKNVEVLMPERYRARHHEAIKRIIKTGKAATPATTREFEALRKDGTEFPISIAMSTARVGDRNIFLAIIRDVTETKKREFELKKLSAAIEQSINAVFITDRDGTIEYVNRTFERITGYMKNEAVGQKASILSSGETSAHVYEEMWNTILSGRTWRGTIKNRTKTGGHYWCNSVISPIRDERGRITHFLAILEDVTEKRASKERLEYFAAHDEITGLLNRSKFRELLNHWIIMKKADSKSGALFMIDIDQFKFINDTYGHAMGDIYLRRTGKLIEEIINPAYRKFVSTDSSDPLLARLSGDEYALFLPGIGMEEAEEIAEELRKKVEGLHLAGDYVPITLSIGIVIYPDQAYSVGELLARADAAMYRAKDLGRNRFHIFKPEDRDLQKIHSRMESKRRIVEALKEERFEPWFQPILDLKDDTVTHYEVLARMIGEDGSILSPGAFIDVAETFGLIGEVDRMIIRKALMLQSLLKAQGKQVTFSLNLSGIDLGDEDFLTFLKEELAPYDRPSIIFEVTETAAVKNLEEAVRFISELKVLGCEFSLDDFGVGFTSFVYLKEMDVDYVKIDGSFIRRLHEDPQDQLLVKAMIDVAGGLGIKTIAEFVETGETLALLRKFSVDYAQGYYIGKPGPVYSPRPL